MVGELNKKIEEQDIKLEELQQGKGVVKNEQFEKLVRINAKMSKEVNKLQDQLRRMENTFREDDL